MAYVECVYKDEIGGKMRRNDRRMAAAMSRSTKAIIDCVKRSRVHKYFVRTDHALHFATLGGRLVWCFRNCIGQ